MAIVTTRDRARARMPYFFYGTLLDGDIQRIVLGRRLPSRQLIPAVAHGYRRVYVKGAWYPTLAEGDGGPVAGCVVHGLSAKDRAKIDWFEDDDYVLGTVEVSTTRLGRVSALAYMPPSPSVLTDTDWTLDEWRRRFKQQYVARSKRWMVSNFDAGW
ncbi:MAG: gamma-glutamylcyclotransferase family protein [Rhodospirillales bacterium]